MAKKLKYIQIQPDKDFFDMGFMMLSPHLRGIYLSIKMFLYINDGVCQFNPAALATITNCPEFAEHWPKVEQMFVIKNNKIRHKAVTADLRRAKKFLQAKRSAGLKGAQRRWHSQGFAMDTAAGSAMPKKSKRNETETEKKSKVKTNSTSVFSSGSSSIPSRCDFGGKSPVAMQIKFYDLAAELIVPVGASDRTCLKNIASWLKVQAEKTGDKAIFGRAWRLAQESKRNGRKPMAMLNSLMKTELGYRKLPKEML